MYFVNASVSLSYYSYSSKADMSGLGLAENCLNSGEVMSGCARMIQAPRLYVRSSGSANCG